MCGGDYKSVVSGYADPFSVCPMFQHVGLVDVGSLPGCCVEMKHYHSIGKLGQGAGKVPCHMSDGRITAWGWPWG